MEELNKHPLLSKEHADYRKKLWEFAENEIQSGGSELDEKGIFSDDIVIKMDGLGLFGKWLPKQYGGQNLDTLSYIIAVEELAWVNSSQAATIAAIGIGLAQGVLEIALKHGKRRKQLGQPPVEFQVIAFKLAGMEIKLQLGKNYLYHWCWMKDNNLDFSKEAAMAKIYASEMANEIADEALQIFNKYGLMKSNAIERFYRDLRILQFGEGTSEILKLVIYKKLLS